MTTHNIKIPVFRCATVAPCPARFRGSYVFITEMGVATSGPIGALRGRPYMCPTRWERLDTQDAEKILAGARSTQWTVRSQSVGKISTDLIELDIPLEAKTKSSVNTRDKALIDFSEDDLSLAKVAFEAGATAYMETDPVARLHQLRSMDHAWSQWLKKSSRFTEERLCVCGVNANSEWDRDSRLTGCPKCGAVWPEKLRTVHRKSP